MLVDLDADAVPLAEILVTA